jgi:hypothetical protein
LLALRAHPEGKKRAVCSDVVHTRRKAAGERLLYAWALAILPNTLDAFGVDFADVWWWYAVRVGLSAIWLAALIVWAVWLWRDRRAARARDARA